MRKSKELLFLLYKSHVVATKVTSFNLLVDVYLQVTQI